MRKEGLRGRVVGVEPRGRVLGGMPGVEVGVEVDDGDGLTIFGAQGAKSRERDAVVAAEGDET